MGPPQAPPPENAGPTTQGDGAADHAAQFRAEYQPSAQPSPREPPYVPLFDDPMGANNAQPAEALAQGNGETTVNAVDNNPTKERFPFYEDPGYLLFRYPITVSREDRTEIEPIEVIGAYSTTAVLHQDLMPPMPTNGVNEDRAGTGPFTAYMMYACCAAFAERAQT